MKIARRDSFAAKLAEAGFGAPVMVSESNAPIKLKYMGHGIELDGNEEWRIELEQGDTYEFVPAKTLKQKPYIIFRQGREKIELRCSPMVMLQVLSSTHFPRGRSKENIMYMTAVRQRRTKLYTVEDAVLSNKWLIKGSVSLFNDAAGNLYIEFDLLNPLHKLMKPTPMARLRSAFKQEANGAKPPKSEPAPAVKPPRQTTARTVEVGSIPVSDPAVGADGTNIPTKPSTDMYIASIESKMHNGSSWVVVAPTVSAARSLGNTLLNDARVKPDVGSDVKLSLYKVGGQSPIMRVAKTNGTLVSTKLLLESGKFMRTFQPMQTSVGVETGAGERSSSEIDISHLNVSWSNYDPDKVYLVLSRLFNDGFFSSTLRPRATTKGLVFDFPASMDKAKARQEILGASRRVYQYLHGRLGLTVHPTARWSEKAALIRFNFQQQSKEERESIELLMKKPPLLEAPIYTLDTQPHLTYAIESFNKNTGKVVMWQVRDGNRITRKPTVVLYTRLRKFNTE